MKNFKVIQSNPNSKGGFVTKISTESIVVTPFGKKTKKETYYVSGSTQLVPDTNVAIDMNMFKVAEHPMTNTATGEEFMAKWLHLA